MKPDTVPVAQLEFDTRNPRINAASNQTAALNSLVESESSGDKIGEKILHLAKSICENGFDGSERLMVMQSPAAQGRYIVLDGNRRLAALKLLADPAWADRDDLPALEPIRKRLQVLRDDYGNLKLPQELDIAIYPSRADANRFIKLKHTGEHEGAGRSRWNAMQQARFENSGSYQLLQDLLSGPLLELEARKQIEAGAFPITTFERAAVGAAFTTRFGGRIATGTFSLGATGELSARAWARIANDTANGAISSRVRLGDREGIETYLDEVLAAVKSVISPRDSPDDSYPGGTPTGEPGSKGDSQGKTDEPDPPGGAGDGDAGQPGKTTKEPAAPRAKRQSKYLIPRRQRIVASSAKPQQIIDELGKVSVDEAPYACALLIRALLEITAEEYLTVFQLSPSQNASQNIRSLALDLRKHQHGPSDPADRIAISDALKNESDVYGDLCKIAHSTIVQCSPAHVRTTWDNAGRGIELAWQRVHQRQSASGREQ